VKRQFVGEKNFKETFASYLTLALWLILHGHGKLKCLPFVGVGSNLASQHFDIGLVNDSKCVCSVCEMMITIT
jgi:hypothetical protein